MYAYEVPRANTEITVTKPGLIVSGHGRGASKIRDGEIGTEEDFLCAARLQIRRPDPQENKDVPTKRRARCVDVIAGVGICAAAVSITTSLLGLASFAQ